MKWFSFLEVVVETYRAWLRVETSVVESQTFEPNPNWISNFEPIFGFEIRRNLKVRQQWWKLVSAGPARDEPSFSCSLEKVLQRGPRQNSEFWVFRRVRSEPRKFGPVSTLKPDPWKNQTHLMPRSKFEFSLFPRKLEAMEVGKNVASLASVNNIQNDSKSESSNFARDNAMKWTESLVSLYSSVH